VIDDPRPRASSRTWLLALGSAVAVLLVVAIVGLAAGNGRHRSATSLSGVFPSPTISQSVLPSSLPSALLGSSASDMASTVVATATPLASPAGMVPTAPSAGFYFCQGATGMATCADQTGKATRQLAISMLGPNDETYNQRDGYVYYRESLSDAHGSVERISRVALTGGAPQIIVQGPDMLNETQVSFGSPISSPDGDFLAYGQMTIAFNAPGGPTQTPSPGAQTVGPPSGPPNVPNTPVTTRLVQIKIQNLHDLKAPPAIVPPSMMSSDIAAYPLLGWSADNKQLFLVGPGGKVDSIAIGADGVATGVSTVFDPATLAPDCQVSQTVLSSSGDFFVVSSCTNTINVVKVHKGTPQPYGSIVKTTGWQVDSAQLDTTGQVLALTWSAPPNSPQCVAVDGGARIVDGVPTAITLETTPGCIYNPGPAVEVSSP
jgi:hypothetical protein